jgi:hypothetical protein
VAEGGLHQVGGRAALEGVGCVRAPQPLRRSLELEARTCGCWLHEAEDRRRVGVAAAARAEAPILQDGMAAL